jgi:hypothetical protein
MEGGEEGRAAESRLQPQAGLVGKVPREIQGTLSPTNWKLVIRR